MSAAWLDVVGLIEDGYSLYKGLGALDDDTKKKSRAERFLERAKRIETVVKKINSILGRVEKGVAMAR